MAMRTIGVKLRMETSDYVRDGDRAVGVNNKIKGSLDETGLKAKSNMADLATAVGIGGTALLGFAGAAVYAAATFDKQMSEVAAVSNATGAELDQLRQAALKAGKDTAFSATEAAKAEAELAKAGVSTADILGGALTGSLALASAGTLDLTEAATIAAQAMNMFNLGGRDVGHVADVLAAAANKSATDVHDLGEGLKQGGLVAKQFGIGLEDTAGTLALFADNALVGSDAGTSLKTMLIALASPSEKAAAAMDDLGINAYTTSGQFVGVADLAGQLHDKLGDLSDAERNTALATIFGTDAMRAAGILMDAGRDKVFQYAAAVDDQGAAAEVAGKKMDNLAGDIEKLKGSLETLAIESGSGANEGLRTLVQLGDRLVDLFGELPTAVSGTGVVLAGLSGAALLAVAGALKLRSVAENLATNLDGLGRSGERAATGVRGLAKWGPIAAGALGVMVVAAQGLDMLNETEIDLQSFTDAVERLGRTGEVTSGLTRVFGDDLEDLADQIVTASTAMTSGALDYQKWAEGIIPGQTWWDDLTGTSIETATKNIGALDEQLAELVRTGHSEEALQAIERLEAISGLDYGQVTAALPQYHDALMEADAAQKEAAASGDQVRKYQEELAASNIALGGAFGEAANQVDGLKNAFDELNGKELDWRAAQRDAEAALDDLQAALADSDGSLSIHTEKGRAAAAATDRMAEAAVTAAQKKYDETGSIKDANDEYNHYIGKLRDTLSQAGLTKGQIDKLIGSIAKVPSYKSTTVEVKIKYVESGFGNSAYAQYFSGGKVQLQRWGGVTEHAQVGLLRDPAIYNAVSSGARYAFAEAATGGEAFVPKRGDYGRSMSILGTAAGWYGASVVPRGAWYGSDRSGGGVTEFVHRIIVDGAGSLTGLVRHEITSRSGDPDRELRPVRRRP